MVSVPLLGADVAPRFCPADRFLIAELDRGRVRRMRRITIPEGDWLERLQRLSSAGVEVLLCGGFNRRFLPLAEGLGIRVVSGLAGEAVQLVDAFARGDIERHRFIPMGAGRRHYEGLSHGSHESDLRQSRENEYADLRRNRSGGNRIAHGTWHGPPQPDGRQDDADGAGRPGPRRRTPRSDH